MKKASRIISVILAVIMTAQCSFAAFAETRTGSPFKASTTYTHQTKFDGCSIEQGIDVSYHNENGKKDIDWKKVKNAGVDFAILRAGYRGYAAQGKLMPDVKFSKFIHDAHAQGIKLGIYFYSQALTTDEAAAEAAYTIQLLQSATSDIPNFKLDMPIFYDYEFAGTDAGRLDSAWANQTLNKTKMTNNALAFCNAVKNAGYEAMIYANKDFLTNKLNKTTIANSGYDVWLAHYTTKTDYSGDFSIWQYTSTGKVDGIEGSVDCNFKYVNNTEVTTSPIADQGYNGKEIKPEPEVKYNGTVLAKDKDYTLEYYNNVNVGTANLIVKFVGEYANVPMKVVSYKIVPPAVTGVSLVQRNTKSVEVRWNPVEGVDNYKVQVKKSTGWVDAGTVTATSHTVSGLAVASNYQVRVRGCKTIMEERYEGVYSEPLQTATKPEKIKSLSVSSQTTTSVTLSWKKQTNASYYEVFKYNTKTAKYELCVTAPNGSTKATVKGLSANKSYKFKVRAVKKAKEGVIIKGVCAQKTAYTKAKAPSISKLSSSKSRKLTVKWKKVSSVSGYQVKWSRNSKFTGSKTVTVKGSSKTSTTVTTSKKKKYYYVKVRAYRTVDGVKIYSSWSSAKKIKVK